MRNNGVENPMNVLEQGLRGQAASSFAAVLDLIILTQEKGLIDKRNLNALRLTCKATRAVVDSHVQTVRHYTTTRDFLTHIISHHSLGEISWPWPNINKMSVYDEPRYARHHYEVFGLRQEEMGHLVSLPLLKLKSLELRCWDVVPLAQSNWPMLTSLELSLKSIGFAFMCSVELQFPKWPLERLKLVDLEITGEAIPQIHAFLGAALKSSPELKHLQLMTFCTEKVATILASTPLLELQSLQIWPNARPGSPQMEDSNYFATLFNGNWPALRDLSVLGDKHTLPMSLPVAKSWVMNLVNIDLMLNETLNLAELRNFLQDLEKGAVEKLSLQNLKNSLDGLVQCFQGMKLEHLKLLALEMLTAAFDDDDDGDGDVSDLINVLFDTCSLPKLDKLEVGFLFDSNYDMFEWIVPPKTALDSFPQLKEISLSQLFFSEKVTEYLGAFRKHDGCRVILFSCDHERELSLERELFLEKLGIDFADWKEHTKESIFEESMFWNTLTEDHFQLSVYAAALRQASRGTIHAINNVRRLIKVDLEEGELTLEVSKPLEEFLNRMAFDEANDDKCEIKNWIERNVSRLTDFPE